MSNFNTSGSVSKLAGMIDAAVKALGGDPAMSHHHLQIMWGSQECERPSKTILVAIEVKS